jgi:hypothetical protein
MPSIAERIAGWRKLAQQRKRAYQNNPTPENKTLWDRTVAALAKLRRGPKQPRIVTAKDLGIGFINKFGALGPELYGTGHHSAGPVDVSDAHCATLLRQYHAQHNGQGWGGIGYHYCLSRKGTLFCLRPTNLKGAHVGAHNSNNIGVLCHGTTGNKPTAAQQQTFRWLLENAHTSAVPKAHRTDRDLSRVAWFGHNDWSGHHSNACPGTHKTLYVTKGKKR